MLIEAAGLLGFGMHQQAAAADGITEAGDPADHIQQQGRTEALAFMAFVYPEPGQQGNGLDAHTRHAPGVVSHDGRLVVLGNHKHAGGAGAMGLPGELHQPGGLFLGAAAEACQLVTGRQQLRRVVAAHPWG